MPLTILSDSNVKALLENLTKADVEALQKSLRQALHEYSTGTQDDAACASQQPERISHTSHDGLTMLFMPSTSSTGLGMKVIAIAAPSDPSTRAKGAATIRGSLTIMGHDGQPTGFLNAEEVTAFRTALASTLLICRRSHLKTLTVFGAGKQAFWHIRLALLLRGHSIKHINIINRTLSWRTKYLLRSFLDVDHRTKTHEGWSNARFAVMSPEYNEYDRLIKEQLRAADAIIMTVPSTEPLFDHLILTSTEGRKKGRLLICIGSYKPHMIELPVEMLHQAVKPTHDHRHFHRHAAEGGVIVVDTLTGCLKEAGEIIQAGLSPMQLVEIGELVMLEEHITSPPSPEPLAPSPNASDLSLDQLSLDSRNSSSSRPSMASVMGSDGSSFGNDGTSTSKSSKRSSSLSRALSFKSSKGKQVRSSSVDSSKRRSSKDDEMSRWLSDGNVIYKSVGMGLMDLVVGGELVRLARMRGVGTTVQEF